MIMKLKNQRPETKGAVERVKKIEVVHVNDKMLAGGIKSALAPVQETSEVQ
jgi:hypothetical protein